MAEFTEVMRQRERMCDNAWHCNECTLSSAYGVNCVGFLIANHKEAEEIIMKWAAEHMTNAQKFKEVFGVNVARSYQNCDGINCPEDYEEDDCENCPYKGFWGKEYKEPEGT